MLYKKIYHFYFKIPRSAICYLLFRCKRLWNLLANDWKLFLHQFFFQCTVVFLRVRSQLTFSLTFVTLYLIVCPLISHSYDFISQNMTAFIVTVTLSENTKQISSQLCIYFLFLDFLFTLKQNWLPFFSFLFRKYAINSFIHLLTITWIKSRYPLKKKWKGKRIGCQISEDILLLINHILHLYVYTIKSHTLHHVFYLFFLSVKVQRCLSSIQR